MEMVVSSVEMHKLNATDKELPIQFCGEREMGPGTLKVMLLALLLAANDTIVVKSTGKSINSKPCELSVFLISIAGRDALLIAGDARAQDR